MTSGPTTGGGRVVLVHRYFWPDRTPYAHMLAEIAGALAEHGHRVTVLTCQPAYRPAGVGAAPARERRDDYDVVRWRVLPDRTSRLRKLVNLIWFSFRLVGAHTEFRRADVVMAATTPPVVVAWVVSTLARLGGARFVYHKQDVYPEVLGRHPSRPLRLLRRVDARLDAAAAAVVVLSDDMARTVADRTRGRARTYVINNFDPWDLDDLPAPVRSVAPSLKLVFAGNLGHFQGLDRLRDLIAMLGDDPRVEFHFFGDGAYAAEFDRLSLVVPSVHMHGFRPAEEVAAFVRREADLGIVCLEPGVVRAAYPSKTMTYLRNGCPLLALVEPSELRTMVDEWDIGPAGGADDLAAVADELRTLAGAPAKLEGARDRAAALYRERFAADRQLRRWVDMVDRLVTA